MYTEILKGATSWFVNLEKLDHVSFKVPWSIHRLIHQLMYQSLLNRHSIDMQLTCRSTVNQELTAGLTNDTDHRLLLDEKLPIHHRHFTVISPTLDRRSVVSDRYIRRNWIHILSDISVDM